MKLNRRSALLGAGALSVASRASAQDFPSKPIKIVVPFAAGSATDIAARALGAKLADILKQPVIVDDKPGASGQLGASAAATAPADGYTLMMGTNTNAANGALFKLLRSEGLRAIARCITGVNALVVNRHCRSRRRADRYARRTPASSTTPASAPAPVRQMFNSLAE